MSYTPLYITWKRGAFKKGKTCSCVKAIVPNVQIKKSILVFKKTLSKKKKVRKGKGVETKSKKALFISTVTSKLTSVTLTKLN